MPRIPLGFTNPIYTQSAIVMFVMFASMGFWWSFFQIWLTSEAAGLGFNGGQVGTIYSANSAGTIAAMLIYGAIQDRIGTRRDIALVVGCVAAAIAPFVIWVYEPLLRTYFALGVSIGAVVLPAGFMAGSALIEALTERLSRHYQFSFGKARMWGSFGYAGATLVAGLVFTIEPHLIYWCSSLCGVLLLVAQVFWRTPNAPAAISRISSEPTGQLTLREILAALTTPSFWLILVFVIFSRTFHVVFDQQMFPEFYASHFPSEHAGQRAFGIINAVQVLFEALMMGAVPWSLHRLGVRRSLLIAVTILAMRIIGCSAATSPMIISLLKLVQAVDYPLFFLAIFRYITIHFNPALSATLYMVGVQIATQIGSMVASPSLGLLRDHVGYPAAFRVIAAVLVCAGIYGYFVLRRDEEQTSHVPVTPR